MGWVVVDATLAPQVEAAVHEGAGDVDAKTLFRTHARFVCAFIERLGVSAPTSHDLVQDVFLIVHRKGATPAGDGALGLIPGSMADSTYIARGKGDSDSLDSASHGAGRVMSRTKAKKNFSWDQVAPYLAKRKVKLLSAGLDEVPMVYKNIDEVMAAQSDLVEPLAKFQPRLVKMAPAGERPED